MRRPMLLLSVLQPDAFKNGDVLTVGMDLGRGVLRFARNGIPLGEAFTGVRGPLAAIVTLASEESKVTIQNRPTVLNMGEYTGELRWVVHAGAWSWVAWLRLLFVQWTRLANLTPVLRPLVRNLDHTDKFLVHGTRASSAQPSKILLVSTMVQPQT